MRSTTKLFLLSPLVAACLAVPSPVRGAQAAKPATQQAAPATAKPAAAAPAAATLTAEQIVARSIEAEGGRAALEKHKSSAMKGTISLPAQGLSGTMEVYQKAPNKMATVTNVANMITATEAYDGTTGWANDSMNGTRLLLGAELATIRRAASFNPDLQYKTLYKTVESLGKQTVEGKDYYVVKFTPAEGEGNAVTNYYDAQTFLLSRSDTIQESPAGRLPVTSIFSDFRVVDGIKVPFTIEQQLSVATVRVVFDDVKFDVPIDDAKFAKPAN